MSRFTGPLAIREVDVDREIWELLEPLVWEVDELGSGKIITVSVGFKSDGASIPWPLSIFLPRWGRWRRAAALHDLCIDMIAAGAPHEFARTYADAARQFRIAMLASGCWGVTAALFYVAVRLFGPRDRH